MSDEIENADTPVNTLATHHAKADAINALVSGSTPLTPAEASLAMFGDVKMDVAGMLTCPFLPAVGSRVDASVIVLSLRVTDLQEVVDSLHKTASEIHERPVTSLMIGSTPWHKDSWLADLLTPPKVEDLTPKQRAIFNDAKKQLIARGYTNVSLQSAGDLNVNMIAFKGDAQGSVAAFDTFGEGVRLHFA